MRQTSSGALSGSHPSDQAPSGLGASRFDPERIERLAQQVVAQDPYLLDYLLGWFGLANPQPWGAAMSFALEVAYGYGLIRGESDATATPVGLAVADRLQAIAMEAATAGETEGLDPKDDSAGPQGHRPNAVPTQPGVK